MPVYAWKIFLENAIEMVLIIPSNRASEAQTFRNHHHLASSHRTQLKHLMFFSERVSCIPVWRTPFSVVPTHRTIHHKNESWTDGNSLSRTIQMCSCVTYTRVSGNFSLMLSIDCLHKCGKQCCIGLGEADDHFLFTTPVLGWSGFPAYCLYCSKGVRVGCSHGTIICELEVVCVFIHVLCKYIKKGLVTVRCLEAHRCAE